MQGNQPMAIYLFQIIIFCYFQNKHARVPGAYLWYGEIIIVSSITSFSLKNKSYFFFYKQFLNNLNFNKPTR